MLPPGKPLLRLALDGEGSREVAANLPEGANVIIFRQYAEPTAWVTTIKIDGKKLGSLGNGKWTAISLEPGAYEIKTSWSLLSGQRGGKYKLKVEEGKTHFLEIVGRSRYDGMYYSMGSGIGELPRDNGFSRVGACCEFKENKF